MVESVRIPSAVVTATLIEFHSHSSTGNGGGVTRPSGAVTLMPSASFQCSQEIWSGIRLPVAKLPARSEMAITISRGNMISAINRIISKWVSHRR